MTGAAPPAPRGGLAILFSRRLARYGLALVLYLAVTGAYFAPLIAHPGSSVLVGFSDATQAIRTYDVTAALGATPFTFHHDPLNGAPEGMPMLTQPVIAQPIQHSVIWALRGPLGTVAAFNAFLLAGFVLTAFAGFALLDWARLGMLPSLFGGFVMAFNPWMVERAVSGHVAFMHGWTLIVLLGLLAKLRLSRTLRWAMLAGLCYGLCFLFAAYMGLLATAFVVAFAISDLVAQRSPGERLWTFTLLAVMAGVTSLALAPGIVAYALGSSTVTSSLSHDTRSLQLGGATPADYLLPVLRHPVLGSVGSLRSQDTFRRAFHEQYLFVGYVVFVLAALTGVRLVRGSARFPGAAARSIAVLAAVAIPIAFVVSMQREVPLLGIRIPMPSYFLEHVTTFFRIYARLGYVVEIGLAVLAALALCGIANRSRRGLVLSMALVAIAVFEFLPGTLSVASVGSAPAYDRWLARQPSGIVAHYPLMTDQRPAELLAASELYYQRFTLQPLYEIYGSERRGTREDAIRLVSRYVDTPNSLRVLAAEGVRYVVIHADVYRDQGQVPPRLRNGVRPLRSFGPVHVYRLTAKPINLDRYLNAQKAAIDDLFGIARPAVSFTGGFYPPETYAKYPTPFQWMRETGDLEVKNGADLPVKIWLEGLGFSNGDYGRGITRRLDLSDRDGSVVASATLPPSLVKIRLGPIIVPPGTSSFTLRASFRPAPLGPGDPRVASVFLSNLRASPPAPDLSRSLRR